MLGGRASAASARDEDMIVKAGPFDLPNNGYRGTLTWDERELIRSLTGVSAAVRDRKQTHGHRHLTLSGPMSGIAKAKSMAMSFVEKSMRSGDQFAPTRDSEGDWQATVRQVPVRQGACSSSSSWMQMQQPVATMQHPMMATMHGMNPMMMYQQQMMSAMQQQSMQNMMGMPSPQVFAQPMYVMVGGTAPQGPRPRVVAQDSPSDEESDKGDESSDDADADDVKPHKSNPSAKSAKQKATDTKRPDVKHKKPDAKLDAAEAAEPKATTAAKKKVERPPTNVGKEPKLPREPPCPPQLTLHKVRGQPVKKQRFVSARDAPGEIKIMTAGWRQQGCDHAYTIRDLMDGENGLTSKLESGGIAVPDIVVDCRPLKRHDLPKVILNHTGYHHMIIEQVVHHKLFKEAMTDVLDDIMDKMQEDPTAIVNVLAVCTGGNHRSVAFALVLKSLLHRKNMKTSLRHLSEANWRSRRMCLKCDDCDEKAPQRAAIMQDAFDIVTG